MKKTLEDLEAMKNKSMIPFENVEMTDGNHITTKEFIEELKIKESDDRDSGAVKLFNEDEEYYLMNIGDGTRCMKNPKIINIKEI